MSDWKNGGCRQITEQTRDVRAQFRFNRLSAATANSIISIVHSSLTTCPTAG
jgi:hypothetical protein